MEVVFLKAKQRLIKEINAKGIAPYPLVKKVTSYHHQIEKTHEGFDNLFQYIQKHAAAGACMYKGLLKRKKKRITKSFRSGQLCTLLWGKISCHQFSFYGRQDSQKVLSR